MSNTMEEISVPDIGDFDAVEIIEILVGPGDVIQTEDSLISVESDKASMEIPSPRAGTVKEVLVSVGDNVSQGSPIIVLEVVSGSSSTKADDVSDLTESHSAVNENGNSAVEKSTTTTPSFNGTVDESAEVVVLGSGPGGYTAAFRAADLGKKVILIERYDSIGGVCLNVGCIPSKALLHTAEILNETRAAAETGITFAEPTIDIDQLRTHKNKIVGKLTGGLKHLAKQRKVKIRHGTGQFTSANTLEIAQSDGKKITVGFEQCVIAAGSRVIKLPFIPWDDPRVMDSTDALEIKEIPKRLLIVGGGIIGLEMATVYDALGSKVTVVELSPGLIPGVDRDIVRPLERRIKKQYENVFLSTKVTAVVPSDKGLVCSFEGKKAPESDTFDAVLVCIGRCPNGSSLAADKAGVVVDDRGFIQVDRQMKTNVDHIYAIGDIVGQPMLAHKATHEAKVAAEVISGMKSYFDARTIPSVCYTDPEIAWMGKTEEECKAEGIEYTKGAFPWAASGRSLSIGRDEGLTKVLFDQDHKIIGAAVVGTNAGELIAEAVLALEMGADVQDLALTIHPHPTLSETLNFAAEVAEGTCTDIYLPK